MYEFDARSRRSMRGMGWNQEYTINGQTPAPLSVYCSGGRKTCAPSSERSTMELMGCTHTTEACGYGSTSGNIYCCPLDVSESGSAGAGRPGSDSIRRLQTAINMSGCSAGTVDGVWGSNTRQGLECWAARVGWPTIVSLHPIVTTLMTVPTTGGGTTSSGGGAAPTLTTPPPSTPTQTEEASIYDQWYFWAGLAAVAAVGVAGVAYYQRKRRAGGDEGSSTDTISDFDVPRLTRRGYSPAY